MAVIFKKLNFKNANFSATIKAIAIMFSSMMLRPNLNPMDA